MAPASLAYGGGGFSLRLTVPRVTFGPGAIAGIAAEAAAIGLAKPLILSTPQQADLAARVAALVGGAVAGTFAEAEMHTPVAVTERALVQLRESGADGTIAVGGGSAIGLGKALGIRTGQPQLCLPTTYAGSEMTQILGETEGAEKRTRRDPGILPTAVIYDPDLTATLPPRLAGASGLNALAHALEALYAPDCNPVIALMAGDGIAALARALPMVAAGRDDATARAEALYGAFLCGTCLAHTTMGLHHKLCHVLGGSFGLPHAETHALVLPHVAAFNAGAAPAAMARAAAALGHASAAAGLWALSDSLPIPRSLAELGLKEADLDRAAALATGGAYTNPRPFTAAEIRGLLGRALRNDRAAISNPAFAIQE